MSQITEFKLDPRDGTCTFERADGSVESFNLGNTVSKNPNTGSLQTPDGQVVGGGVNFQPGAAMINLVSPGTPSTAHDGRTMALAIPVPFQFTGVQILIPHLGGFGAMPGAKLLIATSDDIGPGDYSLGTGDLNLKKFITPSIGGVETNTISTNGGESGWLRMVRGGSDVFDLADNGANAFDVAITDRMDLRGVEDVTYTGHYNLLLRYQVPGNVLTRGSFTGQNTAAQFKTDADGVPPFLFAQRAGDSVTDPTAWTRALTPSLSSSPLPPLGIILYGAQRYSGVLFSMDSRGAVSSETSATAAYRSTEFYFETQAKNTRFTVVKASRSGWTEEQYSAFALALMSGGRNTIRHVIHLIDSVNDGAVTQATIDSNKATALRVKARAEEIGAEVTFVVSFPRSTPIPADQLALLNDLETWALQQARRVFNPLKVYGRPDGTFRTGVGFGGNHFVNAAYQDMASRLYDLLES